MEIKGEKKGNKRRCEMRTKKVLSVVLVMVLLASAVPLAVTPAAAISGVYEEKIPFAGEDNELTKDELVNDAILPYMLGEGDFKLDDVGDAAWIYAYWDGKPKTIVDVIGDRTVTMYRPVERVVACDLPCARVIVALDGCDRFVGSSGFPKIFSWTSGVPSVSSTMGELAFACGGEILSGKVANMGSNNVELIASLEPDVIIAGRITNVNFLQEKIDIPIVTGRYQGYLGGAGFYDQIELYGRVLGDEEEAEELISYMKEKIAEVTDITSEIPESEKPRIYYAARGGGRLTTTGYYDTIDLAGGINVAKDCPLFDTCREFTVLKEQIIAWNPDIILLKSHTSKPPATQWATIILEDPDLQFVNAVKNGSVYYCGATAKGYPVQRYIPETMYFAKRFHPDKFEDLDLDKEGNEIMKRFFKADGLYTWYADETGWLREFLDEQQKS